MPDAPDFSQYQLQGSKDTLKDLAELASRQDARDVWDRRGQVVWHDRFLSGLGPWIQTWSGAGQSIIVVASYTEWGGYAVKLTAGSDALALAGLVRFFQPAEVNRWGVECGVALLTEFSMFRLRLWRTVGGQNTEAEVALDRAGSIIKVLTPGSVWETIAALSDPIKAVGMYHGLKVVGDFATGNYVRAIYDNVEYDLSAVAMNTEANPDIDSQIVKMYLYGRAGFNDQCLLGHTIVTVGEP